jgi:NAD(P)-dependent dehydrogenase (short-subunit alcohol dehydrogenase family)
VDRQFEGKSVLIIGGSSGIGLSTAKAFTGAGAKVAITGRTPQTLRAAAEAVGATGILGDIANVEDFRVRLNAASGAFGKIDVLFVNAGVASIARIGKLSVEDWDACHAINLRGGIFAIQASLQYMNDGGAIIISGSVAADQSMPPTLAYATAKAALWTATRILAAELLPRKIRVNMISIGPTRTELYTRGADPIEVAATEERLAKQTPMSRMAEAEEIAESVLFWLPTKLALLQPRIFPWTGE